MTILWIIPGLALPAVNGRLLVELLQRKHRVLLRSEEWFAGLPLGLMLTILIAFALHATLDIPLALPLFLGVQCVALASLGFARFLLGSAGAYPAIDATPLSAKMKIVVGILLAWITFKTIAAATVFLALTPTFLDDTLDNWNLRGKVFYEDRALTLAMPAEDPIASPLGVSSYSPALPLMKTWLATLAGEWNDPLINLIHVAWYVCAIGLVWCAVRRSAARAWAFLGAYALASLPLYLMHGTNAYADAFVSVHVFLAMSFTFFALRATDPAARMSFVRLGATCAGVLPFTKNEGLLLYLPPLLLILCVGLLLHVRAHRLKIREAIDTIVRYGVCIVVLSAPWLIFKWGHGLTFGNAKPISTVDVAWQSDIPLALTVNTFFEGNWLLLFPVLFALIIWRRRAAFGSLVPLTAFFLLVSGGQILLFLFTSLAVEARMQTGLARGVVQQIPVIVLLMTLLLHDARGPLSTAIQKITRRTG